MQAQQENLLEQQSMTNGFRGMGANRGENKCGKNGNRFREKAMIGSTEQNQFDKAAHPGNLTVNLPMPHPLREKKQAATDNGQEKVRRCRLNQVVEEKRCKVDRSSDLVNSPDKNRQR